VVSNIFLIVYLGRPWTSLMLLASSQHRYRMSVPSVDRQRIIRPFIGYSNCWYSPCMFSISSSCWLRSDIGGTAIAKNVLTESEFLEIVYNSDESLTDISSDGVSSGHNETDDIAVADAIINDDSGDYWNYCTEISGGRLWTITQDTQSVQLWFWTQKWCRNVNCTQNVLMLIQKKGKCHSLFSDVICLKFLDHKYRLQLFLNCENCWLFHVSSLSFQSR
jgi:hypothetical protein